MVSRSLSLLFLLWIIFRRFKHEKCKVGVKVNEYWDCWIDWKRIEFLEKNNIPYFETSAKEGINVEKAFETVARNALAREKDIDQQTDFPAPIRIPQQEEVPSREGCSC